MTTYVAARDTIELLTWHRNYQIRQSARRSMECEIRARGGFFEKKFMNLYLDFIRLIGSKSDNLD